MKRFHLEPIIIMMILASAVLLWVRNSQVVSAKPFTVEEFDGLVLEKRFDEVEELQYVTLERTGSFYRYREYSTDFSLKLRKQQWYHFVTRVNGEHVPPFIIDKAVPLEKKNIPTLPDDRNEEFFEWRRKP